ncbi:MAG: lipid-A-disaccharide synthase, partial [Calditrichaeota bacterium]|nr:lipid-A-disaccharide synthase [Calditrichota bacterium]
MKRKILIIAGEVSGDQHAADLVGELKKFDGEIEFAGIGGDRLAAEGVHLHYHLSQLAVLGFSEIVKHLPFIRKVLKHMKQELKGGVQAVILVDYPGFNLRVA